MTAVNTLTGLLKKNMHEETFSCVHTQKQARLTDDAIN